jgi:hypothetical protein
VTSDSVALPRAVKRGKEEKAAMTIAAIIITTRKPTGFPRETPSTILITPATPSAINASSNRIRRSRRRAASGISPARSNLSR